MHCREVHGIRTDALALLVKTLPHQGGAVIQRVCCYVVFSSDSSPVHAHTH